MSPHPRIRSGSGPVHGRIGTAPRLVRGWSVAGPWLVRGRRSATRHRRLLEPRSRDVHDGTVSADDLESYENDLELDLYREYRDVVSLFSYVVETERRFYLANAIDVQVRTNGGEVFFELSLEDAWVWDIYRSSRFVKSVHVVTFKDVNVEELTKPEMDIPS